MSCKPAIPTKQCSRMWSYRHNSIAIWLWKAGPILLLFSCFPPKIKKQIFKVVWFTGKGTRQHNSNMENCKKRKWLISCSYCCSDSGNNTLAAILQFTQAFFYHVLFTKTRRGLRVKVALTFSLASIRHMWLHVDSWIYSETLQVNGHAWFMVLPHVNLTSQENMIHKELSKINSPLLSAYLLQLLLYICCYAWSKHYSMTQGEISMALHNSILKNLVQTPLHYSGKTEWEISSCPVPFSVVG